MKKLLALVFVAATTVLSTAQAQQMPSAECMFKGTDFCRATGGVSPSGD